MCEFVCSHLVTLIYCILLLLLLVNEESHVSDIFTEVDELEDLD